MNITETSYIDGQLKIGDQWIALPDMWKKQIAKQNSGRLYFGIRPEHVKLSTRKLEHALTGTVKYVEDYGNRFGAYVDIGGWSSLLSVKKIFHRQERRSISALTLTGFICLIMKSEKSIGYPDCLKEDNINEK